MIEIDQTWLLIGGIMTVVTEKMDEQDLKGASAGLGDKGMPP